jgi:cellobiose-specific phosphotransferase system component IIC
VDKDRGRFIKTLIIGVAAIAAAIVIGTTLQNTTGFPLPQGVCMGILLLIVLLPLFLSGQRAANHHNFVMDSASLFTARQRGTNEAQLSKNQDLRDKGYISEQEFESRKDSITKR